MRDCFRNLNAISTTFHPRTLADDLRHILCADVDEWQVKDASLGALLGVHIHITGGGDGLKFSVPSETERLDWMRTCRAGLVKDGLEERVIVSNLG